MMDEMSQVPYLSSEPYTDPANLSKEERLIYKIYDNMIAARNFHMQWRSESERMEKFVAGHQWEDEDRARSDALNKPVITYNRVSPMVNSLVGFEVQNRKRMMYVPRDPMITDLAGAADLATNGCEWAQALCGADQERTLAFRDASVRGLGFVEVGMEFEEDVEGRYVQRRIDGWDVIWDPSARQQGLKDANWIAYSRSYNQEDFVARWPKQADEVFRNALANPSNANGDGTMSDVMMPLVIRQFSPDAYTSGAQEIMPGLRDMGHHPNPAITVVNYQYRELETVYRVADPTANVMVTLTKKEFSQLKKRIKEAGSTDPILVTEMQVWKYKRVLCANRVILEKTDIPEKFGGFTIGAITCYWDPTKKTWYGVVRAMIDPQKGTNKYFSLAVHLLAVSPKGTLFVEEGAVKNPKKLMQDLARPGAPVHLNAGALSEGKVQFQQPPQFPGGINELLQYSVTSLHDVLGFTPDMLQAKSDQAAGAGNADESVPALNQQALSILAPLFQAYTGFRHWESRMCLEHLRKYLSDGRWVRIGGAYNSKFVQLLKNEFAESYDFVLDEMPSDPAHKRYTWKAMQPILPMLFRQEAFPMSLLRFAPLPASVISEIEREVQSKAEAAQKQGPMESVKKDEHQGWIASEIEKNKSQAALNNARAKTTVEESAMDLAVQTQRINQGQETLKSSRGDRMRTSLMPKGFPSKETPGAMPKGDNTMNQMQQVRRNQTPKGPGVRVGNGA